MRTSAITRSLSFLSLTVVGLGLSACGGGLGDGVKLETIEIQSVSGIDVDGDASTLEIAQCGLTQLQLLGRFTDGDEAFFTGRAVWSSSDNSIITNVNNPDVFTQVPIAIAPTVGLNTVRVTASFSGLTTSADVRVLPGRLEIVTLRPAMLSGETQFLTLNHIGNEDVVTAVDRSLFPNWSVSNETGSGSITVNNFNAALGTAGRVTAEGDATATVTADLSRLGVDCGQAATVEMSSHTTANLEVTPAGPITLPTHIDFPLTVDLVFPNGQRDTISNDNRLTWTQSGDNSVSPLGDAETTIQTTDTAGTTTLTASYEIDLTPNDPDDSDAVFGSNTVEVMVQDHSGDEAICFGPEDGTLALDSRVPLEVTGLFGNPDTTNCTADIVVDLTEFTGFTSDESAVVRDPRLQSNPFVLPAVRAPAVAPDTQNSGTVTATYSNRTSQDITLTDDNGNVTGTGRSSEPADGDRFTATHTYTLSTADSNDLTGNEVIRIDHPGGQLQIGQRLQLRAFLDFPQTNGSVPIPALLSTSLADGLVPYPNRVTWTSSDPSVVAVSNTQGEDGMLIALKESASPVTITAKLDNKVVMTPIMFTVVQ